MQKRFLRVILSFFSLCLTSSLFANTLIDDAVIKLLNSPNVRFNGAVSLLENNQIIFEQVVSKNDCEQNLHNFAGSQFLIGSISKQITAVMVLKACEEGLIQLDAPISRYLPSLSQDWAATVTVQHLLNHTSGIQGLTKPLTNLPGEKFVYSNLGYNLLGKILESIRGCSFNILVRNLFEECGMLDSWATRSGTFLELQHQFPKLVLGYTEGEDQPMHPELSRREKEDNPSGGLISTVSDLAKWNHCLHHARLLQPTSYEKMLTLSAKRNHRWGDVDYGFGIQITHDNGILEISHNGIIPGYMSMLIHYPTQNISIIILENRVYWTKEWGIGEQKKVFFVHDAIRDIVREYILSK